MIKKIFYGPFLGGRAATGLLILRVAAGLALMTHGKDKITHPFSWMGPDAPVPAIFQFLAAFCEFFGGLALVSGLLTSLAAIGIMATMLVAVLVGHAKDPIIGGPPSKEPALSYFVIALTLFLTGPGTLSLDALLFGRNRATASPNTEPATTLGS